MRALGIDPVDGTRETFRSLLESMSRPGTVEKAPEPADRAIVATLVDHEIRVATDDERLRDALSRQGRLNEATPSEADIVHVRDRDTFDVGECRRGSLVEPSDGATVIYRVPDLEAGGEEALTTVVLSGPGIDGTATLSVALPPAELEAIADAQSYPRGVDAVFAATGSIASLPRSAAIERVDGSEVA